MSFIEGLRTYKFTSKSQSLRGIMATVLGLVAMISFFVSIADSFKNRGEATLRLGAVGFVAIVFSFIGMILGVLGCFEVEKFQFFSRLGLLINVLSFGLWIWILLIGVGVIV